MSLHPPTDTKLVYFGYNDDHIDIKWSISDIIVTVFREHYKFAIVLYYFVQSLRGRRSDAQLIN